MALPHRVGKRAAVGRLLQEKGPKSFRALSGPRERGGGGFSGLTALQGQGLVGEGVPMAAAALFHEFCSAVRGHY